MNWRVETCNRKRKYADQNAADLAAKKVIDLSEGKDQTLTSYHCLVCDKWHIGHVPVRDLNLLPRHTDEFVGVRKDGSLCYCKQLVNHYGNRIIYGDAERKDLKGWIEPDWFSED